MADPTNSSTESAEIVSDSERTLSDIDSDDLSDLDESMSERLYDHPLEIPSSDVEFDSDGKIIEKNKDENESPEGAGTSNMKEEEDVSKVVPTEANQFPSVSGPSSYFPEFPDLVTEGVNVTQIRRAEVTQFGEATTHRVWRPNICHPNVLRQIRPILPRPSRHTKGVIEHAFNRNTCVQKNKKTHHDKQISDLEKEFQVTRLSSPGRSTTADCFRTVSCETTNCAEEGWQQEALMEENYVDLSDVTPRCIFFLCETRSLDAIQSLQAKDDIES